jgi:protein-tyrosine phosphatase
VERSVAWGALWNARDLGGLPLAGGGVTRSGAVFRSSHPDDLDDEGWAAMLVSGVRTIIDLRNPGEWGEPPSRPASIAVVHRPVEDLGDRVFLDRWRGHLGSPGYYAAAVENWPDLVVAAITAFADATPGAVLVHCRVGRDRTGQIVSALLDAAGVEREAVLDDYELGARGVDAWLRVRARDLPSLDEPSERPADDPDARLARYRPLLSDYLDGLDLRRLFAERGADPSTVDRAVGRLT